MSAGHVPTANLTALYANTTPGTVANPAVIDAAIADIVQTSNDNYDALSAGIAGLISGSGYVQSGISNVKAGPFNAKGNGVADDADAFRAATVQGATVFIPSGTYLLDSTTTDGGQKVFIPLVNNLRLIGAGKGKTILKVANGPDGNNKGFQSIFGKFDTTLIENLEVSGITFDMNGQNNLQVEGEEYFNGAIIARKAKNIYVHDCEFKNCAGMQITAFGFDSNDDAEDVRIINNDYLEVSDSISGNYSTDHSSVYVVGNDAVITGNRFSNSNQSSKSTAIETDGHNHFVHSNTIEKYNIAWISASWENYTVEGQIFSENICRDVITGVMFYCNTEGNHKNVKILNNIILLTDGIATGTDRAGIDAINNVSARLLNIDIEGNDISSTADYASITNGYQSGIMIRSARFLNIRGNKIHNLGGRGVYLVTLASGADTEEVEISDNEIWDVGQKHINNYKGGITLQALTNLLGIRIDRNTIQEKDYEGILYGISLQGKVKAKIRDNDIIDVPSDFQMDAIDFNNSLVEIDHKTRNAGTDYRNVACHKNSIIEVLTYGAWYGTTIYYRRWDNYSNIEYWDQQAPTTGSYLKGDVVHNSNPVELGSSGSKYVVEKWICIVDGSPGTWVAQRMLTGN